MTDKQITFIIADLDRYTEGEVTALTLEVTSRLREVTPRDTGWARSNWVPSIGSPAPSLPQPEGRPTAGDVAKAAARSAQGEAEVLNFRMENGATFVTNGVPYLPRLNDGWSAQAPQGFVQQVVDEAVMRSRQGR